MQLTRQSQKSGRPMLNMAAMIDVVFLLLIFFMCTTSFRSPEEQLPTQLPRVGTGTGAAQEDFNPVRIILTSVEDGALVRCDNKICTTFESLTNMLIDRRKIADVPVIIQGQGSVPFRYMVGALNSCHQAELRRVAFSTQEMNP